MTNAKPIIFNTEEVRAILAGRKTRFTLPVKPQPPNTTEYIQFEGNLDAPYEPHRRVWAAYGDVEKLWVEPRRAEGFPLELLNNKPDRVEVWREFAPYAVGDVVWVREKLDLWPGTMACYSLDGEPVRMNLNCPDYAKHQQWLDLRAGASVPAIQMPHWASRLTLRITAEKVARVQDVLKEDDGVLPYGFYPCPVCGGMGYYEGGGYDHDCTCHAGDPLECVETQDFIRAWDSKHAKHGFGWESNPWVWSYEFEVEKGE